MEHVKLEKRKKVYEGSILDVYADTVRLPGGGVEHWDFVSHRKGAAAVLPVLSDGRILLVHQYRHALNRMTWELPAGCRDTAEESTMVCAARELEEETGYHAKVIEPLLSLKTTVAFCDELVDVYLAKDLVPGEQHLDEAENIQIKAWSMQDALKEIFAGHFQDSKTVAAILAYQVRLQKDM